MIHLRKLIVVTCVALTACGAGADGPRVSEARVGQPTGPNAALYFTAAGNGVDDRLLGANTDVAAAVELHQTTTDDDGTMAMAPADHIDLPADGQMVLEPGGFHLMLIDVDRLEIGEMIEVTLAWETAGDMVIEAEVVDPADTLGEGHDH